MVVLSKIDVIVEITSKGMFIAELTLRIKE